MVDLSANAKKFITDLINEKTDVIRKALGESEAKVIKLTRELAESRNEVRSLRNDFERSQVDLDSLEQYGRRMSVRIEGIQYVEGESEKDLFKSIKDDLKEVGVTINPTDIVRFHRSSKPKRNDDGIMVAQCILKFSKWDARRRMKDVNKKARDENKSIRTHNDLTKRRYALLRSARDKVKRKVGRSSEVFAFSDINSNLKIRANGTFHDFNTEAQLDIIVNAIPEPTEPVAWAAVVENNNA